MSSRRWEGKEIEIAVTLKREGKKHTEILEALKANGYERTDRALGQFLFKYSQKAPQDPWDYNSYGEIAYRKPRILVYDIETTDLDAGFGEMLMFGYQWWDEDTPQIIKINDFDGWKKGHYNDRDYWLCEAVYEIMCEADVLIGHFSTRFDHPFIQTRMLKHGLPPIPDTTQIDTWRIAKRQLKFRSNRLGIIADSLGCKQRKDKVEAAVWRMAKGHDEEAIEAIAEYCLQDIRTQKSVTEKLLPVAKEVVNLNLFTDGDHHRCMCGSWRVVRDGEIFTKVNAYERYKCLSCGRWSRGRKTTTKSKVERKAK